MTQENSGKRQWIIWGSIGGTISIIALGGFILSEQNIQKCNTGDIYACSTVSRSDSPRITNKAYLAELERKKEKELERIEREKVEAKKREIVRQQLAAAAAKEKADKEAKFKAEGWWEASNGIYLRWCTDANPCPGNASDHYTSRVWRAMVWCKERACGDIYARMNISSGGAVIGWTNDTAYGAFGQKVVLTFGSHLSGQGEIVEFLARS
jgi:hypothetical protein